jgi:Leucine-rich repeat (LRR) protein
LNNNNLTGIIPPEIEDFNQLVNFHLNNNQLSGSIPNEIGNLTNLTDLYLSGNQLTGAIPPEIGNLSTLQSLHLQKNQFTGLPDLSHILSLAELNIQNNQFTFEDIESNIGISSFSYSPQDSVGIKQDTTFNSRNKFYLFCLSRWYCKPISMDKRWHEYSRSN